MAAAKKKTAKKKASRKTKPKPSAKGEGTDPALDDETAKLLDGLTTARMARLHEIQELRINGYTTTEIYLLVKDTYEVTYGTVRNDIVLINKLWGHAADREEMTRDGFSRYMAALYAMRRKATEGRKVLVDGKEKTVGVDLRLAYKIDRDIAAASGVRITDTDSRTIHLNIESARGFMVRVMGVVFRRVQDRETQDLIIADLEELGGSEAIGSPSGINGGRS